MTDKGNLVHEVDRLIAIPGFVDSHWGILKWQGKFSHTRMDSESHVTFATAPAVLRKTWEFSLIINTPHFT